MKKSTTLVIVVAVVAGAIAFVAIRSFLGPKAPAPNSTEIAPMPGASTESTDAPASVARAIPEVLPDFSLATLEGPPRALSSFQQPSLIVNFWATWCAPCRREIPLLRQLRAERADRGVEVVGVAVDFREDVIKYAKEIGLDYPLLIGEEDGVAAADLFGISTAFPFTIFSDGERRIVAVKIGELHGDEANFILDQVERINAGKLHVEQARVMIRDEIKRLDALRAEKSPS
ncbi:MAG: TlpA family protein disulfide reductase [Gammaproteobacteria bacterium]|nr:TlpA family protein disulfide reductase [Gammaproteobacteria bacterium]